MPHAKAVSASWQEAAYGVYLLVSQVFCFPGVHMVGHLGGAVSIHIVHSIKGQQQVKQHRHDAANTEAIAQHQDDGIPADRSAWSMPDQA